MTFRTSSPSRVLFTAAACLSLLTGCFESRKPLVYVGKEPLRYYENQATAIADPVVHQVSPEEVVATGAPRTIEDRHRDEIWDLPLAEAIEIALKNARVIRSAGTFRTVGNPILNNPNLAPSVYDPAIQESTVFGGRGVEAALSDFDTDFTSSLTWGRDEQVQNSPFNPAGFGTVLPTVASETANFNAGLTKDTAAGGQLSLTHQMNYLGVPPGLFPFPSAYSGNVRLGYRQPLWAGAGTEFTRISGPIGAQTALTQNLVGEGVVIARINQNVTLEDFENNVRNLVLDVENTYWDLHLQYRLYRAAVDARNSSLEQWRRLDKFIEADAGGLLVKVDAAQARDAYYQSRAQAELALGFIYTIEVRLRRLMALPVNDGRVIRPSDEPVTAAFEADWHQSLAEALHERVELRRQKWNVKSLELQLTAAKNLVNPRLDFVSGYNVNAFGDQLIGLGSDDDAAGSPQGLRYAYESLTQGNQTGWTLGFELSMPLGFRHAHSQVRNFELRLVKAREMLAAQELEISHELAVAFQDVARLHQQARSNYNRRLAARDRLERIDQFIEIGANAPRDVYDERLRAIESIARSEQDYFTSLAEYNKAIADLQYRKGTLLEFNKVFLTEGPWNPKAYELALRRAKSRSHALDASKLLHTEPADFAVPRGVGMQLHDGVPGEPGTGPMPEELPVREIPLPSPGGAEGESEAPAGYDDPVNGGSEPATDSPSRGALQVPRPTGDDTELEPIPEPDFSGPAPVTPASFQSKPRKVDSAGAVTLGREDAEPARTSVPVGRRKRIVVRPGAPGS